MVKFNQTVPEHRAEVLDKALDKMIDGVEETMAVKATGPTWRGNEIGPAGLVEDDEPNHFAPDPLNYTDMARILDGGLTRPTIRRFVQNVIIIFRGIDANLERCAPMEPDDLVRTFGLSPSEAEKACVRYGSACKAALVLIHEKMFDCKSAFGSRAMVDGISETERQAAQAACGVASECVRLIDDALGGVR